MAAVVKEPASRIGLGAQPLLLVALLAMLLGLLLSLVRFALRGLAVAVAAAVAIVLLVVEQGQVSTQVLDKISLSALNSISGPLAAHGTLGVSNFLRVEISTPSPSPPASASSWPSLPSPSPPSTTSRRSWCR